MPIASASAPRRRTRPLRVERDDCLRFVTTRCLDEAFLLQPALLASICTHANATASGEARALRRAHRAALGDLLRRADGRTGLAQTRLDVDTAERFLGGVVGAAVARAQGRHGVQVMALVVMSNHLHLLVRTPRLNLAVFMRDVKSAIGRDMNLLYGRVGTLWSRRYDVQDVLDDGAALDRALYTLCNPAQAGMVEDGSAFGRARLAYGLDAEDELDFEYLDRTAWHRAGRPDDLGPFFRGARLRLSPLPALEASARTALSDAARRHDDDIRRDRQTDGKRRVLGLRRLATTAPFDRPAHPKRGRRPYCFATTRSLRSEHHRQSREIHRAFDLAVARAALPVGAFPSGTYPPVHAIAA
jgi:REP element-mobilizing transposase RayT